MAPTRFSVLALIAALYSALGSTACDMSYPIDEPFQEGGHRVAARAFSWNFETYKGNRWPDAKLKYYYENEGAKKALKSKMDFAINEWKKGAPYLQFIESPVGKTAEGHFMVHYDPKTGCTASVGYQKTNGRVNLGDGCSDKIVIHELGHTLGLIHEQQRPDREKSVQLLCQNVDPGAGRCASMNCCNVPKDEKECCNAMHNFNMDKADAKFFDWTGAYDFKSIMQYQNNAFAKRGTITLKSKIPGKEVANHIMDKPSQQDFDRICKIYHEQCKKPKA